MTARCLHSSLPGLQSQQRLKTARNQVEKLKQNAKDEKELNFSTSQHQQNSSKHASSKLDSTVNVIVHILTPLKHGITLTYEDQGMKCHAEYKCH